MNKNCPLCGAIEIQTIETLSIEYLNYLYKVNYDIVDEVKSPTLEYNNCSQCNLEFFFPPETGKEKFYEQLQIYDWYYMTDKNEYSIAFKYLSSHDSILEVGAGRAVFASLVGKQRYTGLEFNDKTIEKAYASNINLLKESIEEHATKGFKYDAVVSFQVHEHVTSPASFIKSCVECLKTGGILILAMPSQDGFLSKVINNILDMPPHHVTHWTEVTLRKIADLFDLFTVAVEHEPVAMYHQKLARKVLVGSNIRQRLSMDYHMIDRRLSTRIISKIAEIIIRLVEISLDDTKGHTVVACYRKN